MRQAKTIVDKIRAVAKASGRGAAASGDPAGQPAGHPASHPAGDARETDTRSRIVATAERLYRQVGYQKTTVADIARTLGMSPANVYRFFRSKDEINEAVGRKLLAEVISAAEAVAASDAPASTRLRNLLTALERLNAERFTVEQKLHDLVAIAISERWDMVTEYVDRMDGILAGIVADGMAAGEFRKGDPLTAARCVHVATMRYTHPRLMVECADFPDPPLDLMLDFCIAALR
ncbi:Transcriptional regulator, TetR family [Rhodovulum sp. PH10]|uniref:TetR/AcrR family transcriptional regulator n=1 Tax=Rhodovulum sp. PH10 TaxID=1187851 RepID=UPI00027C2957|nr:TetR/AcrR family transcriptional regulator [Rhodovulum sp. PH10]EJW10727.1 Transcriptional regulator, TetR family [Rhodovulum sp. PH10]